MLPVRNSDEDRRPPTSPYRPVLIGLTFLILGFTLVASYTPRGSTDSTLNSAQTRALARHADINLARYGVDQGFHVDRNDETLSIYGIGVSIVALPLYAPLAWLDADPSLTEGAVAVVYTAAAGTALLMWALRMFEERLAVFGTVILVFGTSLWPIASTALWQHAPVAFLQVIGSGALLTGRRRAHVIAGASLALATFVRPTMAVFLVLAGIATLRDGRKSLLRFALGATPPIIAILASNWAIWGGPFTTGYSQTPIGFSADIGRHLLSELFGGWRGIFVYSPVLLLSIVGAALAVRSVRTRVGWILSCFSFGIAGLFVIYARWETWHGGWNQYGNRYLIDILPPMVLLVMYALHRLPRLWPSAVAGALVSIAIMTLGVQPDSDNWDPFVNPSRWRDMPIARAFRGAADRPLRVLAIFALVGLAATLLRVAQRRWGGHEIGEKPV